MKELLKLKLNVIILVIFLMPLVCFSKNAKKGRLIVKAEERLKKVESFMPDWSHVGRIRFDSLSIDKGKNLIQVFITNPLSYIPVRENEVAEVENRIREALGKKFKNYRIDVYTNRRPLKDLIPNIYRTGLAADQSRIQGIKTERIPVVQQLGKGKPSRGLYNNNIALWHSHGWYYESKLDRWEWQRARLYGTVEDKFTLSYILPYLVPMLENSGANVFLPKERDWQTNEVIVDNDGQSSPGSEFIKEGIISEQISTGYRLMDSLLQGDNPFKSGTSLRVSSTKNENKYFSYIPDFKSKGRYSVSVSYQSESGSSPEVKYTVFHAGGKTDFLVNQKIGGGTWIYLGTFDFAEGKNPLTGMVAINCDSEHPGVISADAVKFGGGMGNVARRPSESLLENKKSATDGQKTEDQIQKINPGLFSYKLSGKPKYLEGARYYLQGAGFPDSIVYNLNKNRNDYNDDYQSRGEWVNYLMGSSDGSGSIKNGLNIPIDLAFALHTDAGVTPNDSIIGTLGIYSTMANKGLFPNGKSRMASRDLADIIQSQIIDDVRQLFNSQWTRRGLWDKQYSEAWRPNVPSVLLELLSHQNIADMKFGLDPRFQFAVGRSIYKGILKFQAYQNNHSYAVQPLPVDHFSIKKENEHSLRLSWSAVNDPLEETARPVKYKVYQRIDENGFDNGFEVKDTTVVIPNIQNDRIYSYKITAINEGGESFPSETLSAGLKSNSKGILLAVNGFDRICAPATFDNKGQAGIAWWKDQGVADHQDLSLTGNQYDFERKSNWLDDDSPGWGASYGDMEGEVIPGNNFDYTSIHGKDIMETGYSFVSVSDEVFCQNKFDLSPYFATDIIMGEERSTPDFKDPSKTDFKIYTPGFMSKISEVTKKGGNLFISGAYIASEFGESKDTIVSQFAKEILHFTWRTGHASQGGRFYATDYSRKWLNGNWNFNIGFHPEIYKVEAPDGIEPIGKNALTAFRYGENNASAGIVYNGSYKIVALGFPFETILSNRATLMKQIINFFESK